MPPVDGRPLKRKLKPLHTSIGAVPRTAGIVMTAKTDAGCDRLLPSERYGASGDDFKACVYSTDPQKPMARFKASWEKAKRDAGIECRFHDLRHTAVSRMIDAGVPLPKIAKIVGWAPATMVRMAARYGHFNLDSLRDAVASISPEIRADSPGNPPGANAGSVGRVN
jgi:integrase